MPPFELICMLTLIFDSRLYNPAYSVQEQALTLLKSDSELLLAAKSIRLILEIPAEVDIVWDDLFNTLYCI